MNRIEWIYNIKELRHPSDFEVLDFETGKKIEGNIIRCDLKNGEYTFIPKDGGKPQTKRGAICVLHSSDACFDKRGFHWTNN